MEKKNEYTIALLELEDVIFKAIEEMRKIALENHEFEPNVRATIGRVHSLTKIYKQKWIENENLWFME